MINNQANVKTIVITGSTRGIGYGLALAFIGEGHRVVVSGRSQDRVDAAVSALQDPSGHAAGLACDVSCMEEVQALWEFAVERFGRVDIWINNAGIAHEQAALHEIPPGTVSALIGTNITGTMNGVRAAVPGMLAQGGGALYNMEGLGSDGRRVKGLGLYGSSKYWLKYVTDSLAAELKDTPVLIGAIQPGMVLTDMLIGPRRQAEPDWQTNRRIFNILADRVETVAPWIARKVLGNTNHGARIRWLTPAKAAWRFLSYPLTRRDVIGGMD